MTATTPMIARTSLQMSLTLGINRSLSMALRLPGWTTSENAEEGDHGPGMVDWIRLWLGVVIHQDKIFGLTFLICFGLKKRLLTLANQRG